MNNNFIDYIRKINSDTGVFSNNEHIKNATIDFLNKDFSNSIDYTIVEVNGRKQELIVIDEEKYPHTKILKSRPHENLRVGDLIYMDNIYYLVVESNANNDKMQSAFANECNWTIKWICPLTKRILESPAIVQNSTKYNTGKYESKYVDFGTSQVYVQVPCNNDTVYIDTDMRFFLDKNLLNPSVYEVTQVDHYTYSYQGKGICHISMSEDKYNPEKDNIDLLLTDYWIDKSKKISIFDKTNENNINNNNIPNANTDDIFIKFNGKAEIKLGLSKRFEVIYNKPIKFNIVTVDNLYQELIQKTVENNKIKISIHPSFNTVLLPYPFILQILSEDNSILKELNINIIPMF